MYPGATKYEGHHTISHLDRSAMRKIFTFLFLSNVILPAVFLSSLDAVVSLAYAHTPIEVPSTLIWPKRPLLIRNL